MRRSRRTTVLAVGLATAALVGCGGGGLGGGGPVQTKEQIIAGESSLVDPKTGTAGESRPPSDYGPPRKTR